ncbi:hypothetical protein [Mangrovimonas futianensis]|uniref:hypothetical protein n=1 Tax=Mangrovimonas futianensis TaxID=2895523 RepID=UPI001E334ADE|nr:hypothetical protein [Mangrovimonas futianensis]MCF1420839.1 hypothetical protein [Mangrovimonas futianensis]
MLINILDLNLRKFNSVILRLILIVFLVIIVKNQDNYFELTIYNTGIFIYLVLLVFQLFIKRRHSGIIRFILDISIITFCLFEKDLNSVLNFFPYLAIIFNIVNYSSEKSRLKFILPFINASIFIVDNFNFIILHQLIPLSLYVFLFFYWIRFQIDRFNKVINDETTHLFLNNLNEENDFKLLDNLKNLINNDISFEHIFEIEDIFLFTYLDDKLFIIKGTKFVSEPPYIMKKIISEIDTSTKNVVEVDYIPKINRKPLKNTIWFKHNINNQKYWYLISSRSKITFITKIAINALWRGFNQITSLYHYKHQVDVLRRQESKLLKDKITYVLNAKNALHYVRNKLTPTVAVLGLLERYFNDKNLDENQIQFIENRISSKGHVEKIKTTIQRANTLMKGVEILFQKEDKNCTIPDLVYLIRKEWYHHHENQAPIEIKADLKKEQTFLVNVELMEYVFTDIIENSFKYGDGDENIIISIDESTGETLEVIIKNKIKDFQKNKKRLEEIADLYNQIDNDEIYNRKTHGLSFIRRILKVKSIPNEIIIDDKNELFIFKFIIQIL